MATPKPGLKAYREAKKLSQLELAKLVGLSSKASICEIETGARIATVRVALEIERWSEGAVTAAYLNPLLALAAQQAAA